MKITASDDGFNPLARQDVLISSALHGQHLGQHFVCGPRVLDLVGMVVRLHAAAAGDAREPWTVFIVDEQGSLAAMMGEAKLPKLSWEIVAASLKEGAVVRVKDVQYTRHDAKLGIAQCRFGEHAVFEVVRPEDASELARRTLTWSTSEQGCAAFAAATASLEAALGVPAA